MPSYSKVSAGNEDERKVTSNRNRGCLEDCGCNKDRPNRCGCKNLKGCSAACACGGDCALGLREEQEKAVEVDFDTAVRLHDGEDVPTEITERDGGGYFRTIWTVLKACGYKDVACPLFRLGVFQKCLQVVLMYGGMMANSPSVHLKSGVLGRV
jgi:hypothetical protein